MVFGLDGDDTYLLNGTTDFSGEIQAPEGRVITYVIRGALQDCQGEFTLPAEVAEHIRAIQSAAFKIPVLQVRLNFLMICSRSVQMLYWLCESDRG